MKKIAVFILLFAAFFAAVVVSAQEGGEVPAEWEGHLLAGESRSYTIEIPAGVSIESIQFSGSKLDGHPEHGCTDQPDEGEHCDDNQIDEVVVSQCNGTDFLRGDDQGAAAEHWSQMTMVGSLQVQPGTNHCSVYNPAGGHDAGSTNYRISILIRYAFPQTETPTATPEAPTQTPESITVTPVPPTSPSAETNVPVELPVSAVETPSAPVSLALQPEPMPTQAPCTTCQGISCEAFVGREAIQIDMGMGILTVSTTPFEGAENGQNGFWFSYDENGHRPDMSEIYTGIYDQECTVSCAPSWAVRRVDGSIEYLIGLGFTREWTSALIQQTEGLNSAEADAKALRLFIEFYARPDMTTRYGWFSGDQH